MRIAIISGEYPPREGGVGDFTRALSLELQAQGHTLHILTGQQGAPTVTEEEGLTIHRCVPHWGFACHQQLRRWITTLAPDVVNLQYQAAAYEMKGAIQLFPWWQGRHLRVPFVVTFHDLRPPYLFPKAGPLRAWTVWQLARHSHGAILTNDEDFNTLAHQLQRAKSRRDGPQLRLIPIGSNIAPQPPTGYDRTAWRASHGFCESDFLIGFFGFLNRSKGVETLLDAVMQLRQKEIPAQLLLIGGRTGSSDVTNRTYAAEIEARIEALGLSTWVHRTGFTTPTEVSAALLACDACALPYRDGVSLRRGTLHAALVHGQAIVTTHPQTPSAQLQHEQNLLLVPPDDAGALAAALLRLYYDAMLRARLGEQAALLAQEFSWKRIAAHTVDFFRRLQAHRAA